MHALHIFFSLLFNGLDVTIEKTWESMFLSSSSRDIVIHMVEVQIEISLLLTLKCELMVRVQIEISPLFPK